MRMVSVRATSDCNVVGFRAKGEIFALALAEDATLDSYLELVEGPVVEPTPTTEPDPEPEPEPAAKPKPAAEGE